MSERTKMQPIAGLKRTDGVPGPPPRRSAAARDVTERPAAESTASDPAQRERSPIPAPAATPAKDRGRSTASDVLQPISLSIPTELLTRFKTFAKRSEVAQADVVLDALSAYRGELASLVSGMAPEVQQNGLFERQVRRHDNSPLSTLPLRMRSRNVKAIDDLVIEAGAASRSQLCVAALTPYIDRAPV